MGIKDVAARAGVSISTVSYVMSGKRTISKETRDKVMQAAADLGYRPKSQKTRGADDRRLNDTVVGDKSTGTAADVQNRVANSSTNQSVGGKLACSFVHRLFELCAVLLWIGHQR